MTRPTPYLLALIAAYTLVTFISPDMFGAPDFVRAIVNLLALVVIIQAAILLIRDLIK